MERYPLKVENIPPGMTKDDVVEFLDSPSRSVLLETEFLTDTSASKVIMTFTNPDAAFDFLKLHNTKIGNRPLEISPEIFDEMSVSLNASWLWKLRELCPSIDDDIERISRNFQLSLETDRGKKTLSGSTWRVERAKETLEGRFQDILRIATHNSNDASHSRISAAAAGYDDDDDDDAGDVSSKGARHPKASERQSRRPRALKQSGAAETLLKSSAFPGTVQPREHLNSSRPTLDGTITHRKQDKRGHTEQHRSDDDTWKDDHSDEASLGVKDTEDDDANRHQSKDPKKEEEEEKRPKTRTRTLKANPNDSDKQPPNNDKLRHVTSVPHRQVVVDVDIDVHQYLVEHSHLLDFTNATSVTHQRTTDRLVTWVVSAENETDADKSKRTLEKIIKECQRRVYQIPNDVDYEVFETYLRSFRSLQRDENITMVFNRAERQCTVIGPEDHVTRASNWIKDITKESSSMKRQEKTATKSKRSLRSTSAGSDSLGADGPGTTTTTTTTHDPLLSPVGGTSHQQGHWKDSTKSSPGGANYSPGSAFYSLGGASRSSFTVVHSSPYRLVFRSDNNLCIEVYQGDMTRQLTEAIVNPANCMLSHGGGLARVISVAGGPSIDRESLDIVSSRPTRQLETAEVVHTTSGNLRPHIRYVMHAVGPTSQQFEGDEVGLRQTIQKTFFNCLDYANVVLRVSSVSIPPISAGIFGVPLEEIVKGATEAIREFDRKSAAAAAALREVHFISNDATTTSDMIQLFRRSADLL